MGFIEGTKVFTNSGFKNIEDISGRDKVLVRNFIGDAEFIQPFALKKKSYSGEIIKIGGSNWSFSVTPNHIIQLSDDNYDPPRNELIPAKQVEVNKHHRIHRKFRYLLPDDAPKEIIKIRDEFGTRHTTIDHEVCGGR